MRPYDKSPCLFDAECYHLRRRRPLALAHNHAAAKHVLIRVCHHAARPHAPSCSSAVLAAALRPHLLRLPESAGPRAATAAADGESRRRLPANKGGGCHGLRPLHHRGCHAGAAPLGLPSCSSCRREASVDGQVEWRRWWSCCGCYLPWFLCPRWVCCNPPPMGFVECCSQCSPPMKYLYE